MINAKSGGRTRIADIAAGLFRLIFIVYAAPVFELSPPATLFAAMLMVVIGIFARNSLSILRQVPRTDAFAIVLITAVTVMADLASAEVVGLIVSVPAHAWNNAPWIHAETSKTEDGTRVYRIRGPRFFGATGGFAELFAPVSDPDHVIVDFADGRVVDLSALQAIESLAAKYETLGKKIQLGHLGRDCHRLLNRAGHLVVDSGDDSDYALAADYSIRTGVLGGH